MYKDSETTVENVSKRRIQLWDVPFCKIDFCLNIFSNIPKNTSSKRYTPHLDASLCDNSSRGLGVLYLARFVGKLVFFIIVSQNWFYSLADKIVNM